MVINDELHKMPVEIANREDSDLTASWLLRNSLIWVCTVCLGLFDRQLVLEIFEHLHPSFSGLAEKISLTINPMIYLPK